MGSDLVVIRKIDCGKLPFQPTQAGKGIIIAFQIGVEERANGDAGDFLLLHLFGYADPILSRCFTIVMLAAGIRYAARPFVVALRAEKQMWSMAFAYVFAITSALLASLLLIPRYALLGSAIACLTVACCELAAVIVAFLYARRRARYARATLHAIDDPPGNSAKLSA